MEFSNKLIDLLREAESVTVLTGSGISAESDIPTFRDAQQGLWAKYDPHQLATPKAFQENPELVWSWYRWRREIVNKARPNPGHFALVKFERKIANFTLITQNVDGLHARAGSANIIELHGNLNRARCTRDGESYRDISFDSDSLPTCPNCGHLLRPDVVWFGEPLPASLLNSAIRASRKCQLFFSIGTSALVHPAASLMPEARSSGAHIVEINIEPSAMYQMASYLLVGKSGQILPNLYAQAFN